MNDVIGLQRKFQELIDNIMDNFDFHKVHKVMKQLNWHWAFAEEGIPREDELRKEARKLLNECLYALIKNGEDNWSIATGGFQVRATNYRDGETISDGFHVGLKLEFVIEDWDAY